MRSMVMAGVVMAGVMSLTSCAASLEGTWKGKTTDCDNADFDDVDVQIVVLNGNASLLTTLAMPSSDQPLSSSQKGGALDDSTKLAFVSTTTVDEPATTIEYTVALDGEQDEHSGTIDAAVDGGAPSRCKLTVSP